MASVLNIAQRLLARTAEFSAPLLERDLLNASYHRFGNWAHATGIICVVIADILHPLKPFVAWLIFAMLAVVIALIAALAFRKIHREHAVAGLIFATVMFALSGGMYVLQKLGGDKHGVLAAHIPAIDHLQEKLHIVAAKIDDIQNDVKDIKQTQGSQDIKLDKIVSLSREMNDALREISQKKGIPLAALTKILERLGETKIADDPTEIEKKLNEKANEYLSLRDQLARVANDDPQVAALRKVAAAALVAADFDGARLRLREAADIDRSSIEELEARAKMRAQSAVTSLEESARAARLNLRYVNAASDLGEAVALIVRYDRLEAWRIRVEQALALNAQGDEFGDNPALVASIAIYRDALNLIHRAAESQEWATTQNNLGVVLEILGARESDAARLEEAVTAYRGALQEYVRERTPLKWANTQNNLANALATLGERDSVPVRLEQAVAAYRAALQEFTREREPLDWAMTQSNLGNALRILGGRESGTARLEEAVVACRAALQEFTRERVPLDWATTQNNLGIAIQTIGARESGTARLEEAVVAFRAALQERTRERVPLQWAMTQNNLGNALSSIGERESDTARLEQAVAAYRAALQEFTRERVPLHWATTQNNLGIVLQALGDRESSIERLEESIAAYRAALQERTRETVPFQWATTRNNLAIALWKLGVREDGTASLEQAVENFRTALDVFEAAHADYYAAEALNNLAGAEALLAERRAKAN